MKSGYDIHSLMDKIKNNQEVATDLRLNTKELEFTVAETPEVNHPLLCLSDKVTDEIELPTGGELMLNRTCQQQIANKLEMPIKYWDKCLKDEPSLLSRNVNTWMWNHPSDNLFRTLDGTGRAFLSNRYEIIDHFEVLQTIMPTFSRFDELNYHDSYITDDRMYMRVTIPEFTKTINSKRNDIVELGLMVSNSETGMGSVRIEPLVVRLSCTNGMVVKDRAISRKHIGKRWDSELDTRVLKQETIVQNERAWLMTTRDQVDGLFNGPVFEEITNTIIEGASSEPVERPSKAVEVIKKEHKFTDMEGEQILEALMKNQDYTKWGITNAVTEASSKSESADRAVEMESVGWEILSSHANQWNSIRTAA